MMFDRENAEREAVLDMSAEIPYSVPPSQIPPETETAAEAEAKKLPHDEHAEMVVIGCMLLDQSAVTTGVELLAAEDFFNQRYRTIFSAMAELRENFMFADTTTVKAKLEEKGLLEAVGGMQTLIDISTRVSTASNIRAYIKIVADKSTLRKLIVASESISKESLKPAQGIDAIIKKAEKSILTISQKRVTGDFAHISEALQASVESVWSAHEKGNPIIGIPSGFADLDVLTSGFHPTDLILIAARPSMGKTTLGLNIVTNAAMRYETSCAVFSLEMNRGQLANRIIASEARVEIGKLRAGGMENSDWSRFYDAIKRVAKAQIFVDDTPAISMVQLRAKCRKIKMDTGLGLIMVDYLQLIGGGGGRRENRQQEISEISRDLKSLAREMNCPVIALSQLNRAVESRADHRPMLSDLRESGAIEQDADLVCFIYRDEYYNPDSERRGTAEIIIAKQRNGAIGSIDLAYQGQFVSFRNLEQRYY
ncbi:MAG: replicative DNA helicase [Defluviitaleaceae bacterium]|nr:replicative DNA helicase [Defluviitaleaceae bacterium]